jgi:threonine dehydrogenase-like Zn-dependent dehydrogenase
VFLAAHRMTLEDGAKGYDLFKHRKDGCVPVVFTP